MRELKIFIVDDHPIVIKGLREIINIEKDMFVVGDSQTFKESLIKIAELKPDIAIVDIILDGESNGIELVRSLKAKYPDIKTIVLSMYDEALYAEHAIKAGARGYVMKKEVAEKIITAIRKAFIGGIYLSEAISDKILNKALNPTSRKNSDLSILGCREFEVFQYIGNGLTTKEISKRLEITSNTVESHKKNIRKKLDIKNSVELTKYAIHWTVMKNNI